MIAMTAPTLRYLTACIVVNTVIMLGLRFAENSLLFSGYMDLMSLTLFLAAAAVIFLKGNRQEKVISVLAGVVLLVTVGGNLLTYLAWTLNGFAP